MESYKHRPVSNSTTEQLWDGMLLLLRQAPENTRGPLSRGIGRLRTARPPGRTGPVGVGAAHAGDWQQAGEQGDAEPALGDAAGGGAGPLWCRLCNAFHVSLPGLLPVLLRQSG